jgi:hypothetical protein
MSEKTNFDNEASKPAENHGEPEHGEKHRHVRIHIDGERHQSPDPTTHEALYTLGDVPAHEELYREARGDVEDQPLPRNNEKIHLKEDEHFYSREPHADRGPLVEVEDLHTNEEVHFHVKWTDTIQQIWDKAYKELGETRKDTDVFECKDGQSLAGSLSLTLEQLRDKHVCVGLKFQIRGGTGGA